MDYRKQTVSREMTRSTGRNSGRQITGHLFLVLGALAFAITDPLPSQAQGGSYSFSYGGGRVLTESQTGLVHPSGSYLGPGTLSQSARGQYGAGAQVNPGLPRVNMGSTVATPGDNMYGGNPTRTTAPPQQATGIYAGLPGGKMGANVGMPGDNIRSDLSARNNLPMRQQFRWAAPQQAQQMQAPAPAQQGPQAIFTPNGTATYSDTEIKQGIHF